MKVLCLIDSLNSGGAQRQLVGLAQMLHDHSFQVKLVSYWNFNFWDDYLVQNGIDFENIAHANTKIKKLIAVYNSVSKFAPDVVIAYLISPSVIACLIRILSRRSFHLIVSERNSTQRANLSDILRFFLYRWADWVVPNSYTQMHYIKSKHPALAKKTVVITNFVDSQLFKPSNIKKKSGRSLRMLVVGRISPQKNAITFLHALAKAIEAGADLQVAWFGRPNPKNYYDECVSVISKLELRHFFCFMPPTDRIELEYRLADVFCLPSIYEGFPNVICEAMSAGLPILCSNVCDNPYIIDHGENGFLFNPFSSSEITKTILRFLELSDEKRDEMGIVSRSLITERFSKTVFLNKYLNLM